MSRRIVLVTVIAAGIAGLPIRPLHGQDMCHPPLWRPRLLLGAAYGFGLESNEQGGSNSTQLDAGVLSATVGVSRRYKIEGPRYISMGLTAARVGIEGRGWESFYGLEAAVQYVTDTNDDITTLSLGYLWGTSPGRNLITSQVRGGVPNLVEGGIGVFWEPGSSGGGVFAQLGLHIHPIGMIARVRQPPLPRVPRAGDEFLDRIRADTRQSVRWTCTETSAEEFHRLAQVLNKAYGATNDSALVGFLEDQGFGRLARSVREVVDSALTRLEASPKALRFADPRAERRIVAAVLDGVLAAMRLRRPAIRTLE